MTQAEIALPVDHLQPRLRPGWVVGTLLSPARQLREILATSQPTWLTPLLVLSLLAVVEVFVLGGIPSAVGAVDPGISGPGAPYQYYTPEQQAQLDQAMAAMDTPFFRTYLPAGLALGGIWLRWILLGAILHLSLTLIGGRGSMGSILNLLAWASLPMAVRTLVHLGFMFATDRALSSSGISGLLPMTDSGMMQFLAIAARGFDLYFLWQIALIGVGAVTLSENRRARVWLTVAAVNLGFLLAGAVPAYVLLQLSDLTVIRPFLF